MRPWKKLLVGAVALVFILFAGAALFLSQVDPNNYRGGIAGLVEDATGRKLVLGGDLRITLLPVPSLEANDVSFANAPWASQPNMVHIKRLSAELRLRPLLGGRVEIRRLVAIEPEIFLETDASGKGNWVFGDENASATKEKTGDDAPTESLAFDVNDVNIEQAGVNFLDGASGDKIVLDVEALTLGGKRQGEPLNLSLRATYQGLPLTLDGRLGQVGAVRQNFPIVVDLTGSVSDAAFQVKGEIGKPLQAKDIRLDVGLKSPSTKNITDATGVEVEELGPVDVQVRLVEAGGYVSLEQLSVSANPRGTEVRIGGSLTDVNIDSLSGAAGADSKGEAAKAGRIDLKGNVAEAQFSIVGGAADFVRASGLRIEVAADAPSTQPLSKLAGIEFEEIGPVKLSLALTGQDGHFDLDDIELTARPRDTDARVSGSVKNLVLDGDAAGASPQPAKVDLEGAFGQASFTVTGDIAEPMKGKGLGLDVALGTKSTKPFSNLAGIDVQELGPVEARFRVIEKDNRLDLGNIDLSARPPDAQLSVKGSVLNILESPQPELQVDLSAKNLRQFDKTLPEAGPISVSAQVRPSGGVIDIHELVAKLGKSDLSGTATLDTSAKPPSIKATLHAKLIDLTEFSSVDDKAAAEAPTDKLADGKIFSADPLPLDRLKKLNANIDLEVEQLIGPKITLDRLVVTAVLDNGKLTLKPRAGIAGGTFEANVNIDASTQPAKMSVEVGAKKVSIGQLTKAIRGYETSQGLPADLNITLSGEGDSVRALMGGLDGDIRLHVGEGKLNNAVLERVGADLVTQILSVAVPAGEESKTTPFKCGVVRFKIEKGNAVADKTLVMETQKVLLAGGGLIDLKTEELDLGADLEARKGMGIGAGTLSSLMRIQGTLAEPRIGTDLEGLAKTGASIGAAVATGGLSLLAESVYGQVSADEYPCETALARKIEVSPSKIRAILEKVKIKR